MTPTAVQYFPAYCEHCSRASLVVADEGERILSCAFCKATARVILGPAFREADRLTFADIDRALFDANLSGAEANALADGLGEMLRREEQPQSVIKRMIERIPTLLSARSALSDELPRGFVILLTALSARAPDAARRSGEYLTTTLGPFTVAVQRKSDD